MRRRWIIAVLLLPVVAFTGCTLPYYAQAIGGQVSLLRKQVPIDEILADPAYDERTRERLALVTELRGFAVTDLGLPENDSYTSYVDLGRDYVVWNVVAAPEFSMDPVTWCFPVAGCVSYRGYFKREKAEAFAEKLRDDGYDIFSGGSAAYSTLGHFADPVLNTMLGRSDIEIAATLFHELAHQVVYVRNDTQLSESFATAVEQYGVEQWLAAGGRGGELEAYRARLRRQQAFAALVAGQRERLAALFDAGGDAEALRAAKAQSFTLMREEYEAIKQNWNGRTDYDYWFDRELNNASLVAVTSYQRWVPGLRRELERLGPEAFFAAVAALAEQRPAARAGTLEAWNQASASAVLADHR